VRAFKVTVMNLVTCFLLGFTLICPSITQVHAQGLGLIAPGHVIGNGSAANPGEATDYSLLAVFGQQCSTTAGGWMVSLGGGNAQCSTTGGSTATLNGGPVTITTTPNSYTRALVTSQTSPLSGTITTGPTFWNLIDVTQSATVTGAGFDNFGLVNGHVDALRVQLTASGNAGGGPFVAIQAATAVTATGAFTESIGITGSAYTNVAVGITNSLSGVWGFAQIGPLGSLGGTAVLTGVGAETQIATGGSANYRFAVWARNIGDVSASVGDALFGLSSSSSGGAYANMFLLSGLVNAAAPLKTTASFFSTDTAQTVANIFNLPNVTLTGNFANFPNLGIAGNGAAVFGKGVASLPGQAGSALFTCASCGTVQLTPNTNTTSGFDGMAVADSSGNNQLSSVVLEAANNSTSFGIAQANYAKVVAFGSTNAGIMLGTVSNTNVLFGTNNIIRGSITAGGQWQIAITASFLGPDLGLWNSSGIGSVVALGVGVTAPASGRISALTGYKINNASAASGHYLRGNGTDYVDGTIQAGDLPGGSLVNSVSNSDSTLTISPTTGAVVASLNLAQPNTWTGAITQTINQNSATSITINNNNTTASGSGTASLVVNNSANSGAFGLASTTYAPGGGLNNLQNRTYIFNSSSGSGIAVYNAGANPIAFYVSGAQVGFWSGNTPGALVLGLASTTKGQLFFLGATDATSLTISPPTGSLGGTTNTLQAVNDTFVYRATTDTLTNKTLTSSTNSLGGVTAAFGSDAKGDLYQNGGSSNVIVRLAVGTTNQFLGNSGGLAAWVQPAFSNISGTCTTAQGCLGLTSAAVGDIIYASATTPTWSRLADVATGSVLVSGGVNTAPAWSASPTITTSVTTPLHIGGSGTTGTQLTFQTTTGNGTTDAFVWKRGNNGAATAMTLNNTGLAVGASAPVYAFNVSTNTGAIPSNPAGIGSQIVAAIAQVDGTPGRLAIFSAGSSATAASSVSYFNSGGTLASPTATQSADVLGSNFFYGYGTAYIPVAGFATTARENFSSTAGGTELDIYTTPLTTQALAISTRFLPSGGVAIGTTSDPGIGGLIVNGQTYLPNITQTSAAQTGTVCWSSGSSPAGKLTVDTTLGCLSSSERFKERIEPLRPADCLKVVLRLEAVSFFKRREYGGDVDPAEQIGFRAEQVAAVDRRLTADDPDGNVRGVRYMQDSAIYACAFQAIKADNDNLRADLKRLTAER